MTAEQFVYWLHGFAELNGAAPSEQQWQAIRDGLTAVVERAPPRPVTFRHEVQSGQIASLGKFNN